MNKQSKSNIFFFLFILIILSAAFYKAYTTSSPKEAFGGALGEYPKSQDGRILPNTIFPYTSGNSTSTCTAGMIWRNYPEFEVGSYAQETNNIRHPKNPDEGTCTPADFCGALYKNRPATSNVVEPMPPVCKGPGARVNYYKATTQNMMPYYNNNNIQY